jgi:hypothetical protein
LGGPGDSGALAAVLAVNLDDDVFAVGSETAGGVGGAFAVASETAGGALTLSALFGEADVTVSFGLVDSALLKGAGIPFLKTSDGAVAAVAVAVLAAAVEVAVA